MNTKMNVRVTITPSLDTSELCAAVAGYGASLSDSCGKLVVSAQIDTRTDTIEHLLRECRKYGTCDLDASMAR